MTEIKHRIIIESSPHKTFRALNDPQQISQWWAPSDRADSDHNGSRQQINIYFGPEKDQIVAMQVIESIKDSKLSWKCIEGPWVDTGEFTFTLKPHERGTELLFSHSGWDAANEFYMHCNTKWGFFLALSLKGMLETGRGQPHPNEPDI